MGKRAWRAGTARRGRSRVILAHFLAGLLIGACPLPNPFVAAKRVCVCVCVCVCVDR